MPASRPWYLHLAIMCPIAKTSQSMPPFIHIWLGLALESDSEPLAPCLLWVSPVAEVREEGLLDRSALLVVRPCDRHQKRDTASS
jgi:hypothetical protein